MHRLDFKEASETVKAVDEELEALLRVVWGQAARERQRDLCFFLAKYPYKHFVFKNGRPLDPDGQPLPADLLGPSSNPVRPPIGRSTILAQCQPTGHSIHCHRISASISHPGALHAGIAIRPDMRGGTRMSGEPSPHARPSLTSKPLHR
jgi:hypothetical protein